MVQSESGVGRRGLFAGAAGASAVLGLGALGGRAEAAGRTQPGHEHGVPPLRGRGVVYDTGFFQANVVNSTEEPWDLKRVRAEMKVIRRDLNCTAVRLFGGDQDRLSAAASIAAHAGLEVWYSPFTNDLTQPQMLEFLAEAARRCERLRRQGNRVVLTTGSELAFTVQGFIPGVTFLERVGFFTSGSPQIGPVIAAMPGKINAFLAQAVPIVRDLFHGPVTYASLPFEGVDWTRFDIVSADFYPNKVNGVFPASVAQQLAGLSAHGKPVAITEFGCGAFDGAANNAGASASAIEWDPVTNEGVRLRTPLVRDEQEQADYLTDALDIFAQAGVDSAFVNHFVTRNAPKRTDPILDVDRAAFGLVSPLDGSFGDNPSEPGHHGGPGALEWTPKLAFGAVSRYYARRR